MKQDELESNLQTMEEDLRKELKLIDETADTLVRVGDSHLVDACRSKTT